MTSTPRRTRHIEVFISSSFAHDTAREIIEKTLESENDTEPADGSPAVRFTGHRHEKNGYSNIVPGVSSQGLINAYAEHCNAFILYAGNKIGEHTINEFTNILANASRNYHFIFVVSNPEDIVKEQPGTEYTDWSAFYRKYLKDGGIEYYDRPTTTARLAETIAGIRNEMASQVIVPLFPPDINYDSMLSSFQQRYRTGNSFYLHREIDNLVANFLKEPTSLLGIVTGMSLAGKTRVVVENLRLLADEKLRIHYLRPDSKNTEIVAGLNFGYQFPAGTRNILFIDEIDTIFCSPSDRGSNPSKEDLQKKMMELLLANKTQEATDIARMLNDDSLDDDAPDYDVSTKLIELCQYAADHPGRLTIIGTTVVPFDKFKSAICAKAPSVAWINECKELPIKPMTLEEVYLEVRKLRTLNLIPNFDVKSVRAGMPIGALFIDLSSLKNIYKRLDKVHGSSRIFDAIKTLWLWKYRNRNNPQILLDFINKAYGSSLVIDSKKLYDTLNELSVLINVRGNSDYTYDTEEILVDEVFRFEAELGDSPVGKEEAYRLAIDRIIRYITLTSPDNLFFTFAKLCSRLSRKHPELSTYAIEKICAAHPVESLVGRKEDVELNGGLLANGVSQWVAVLIKKAGSEGNLEESRRLYSMFPDDRTLTAVLSFEQNRAYYHDTIFGDGKLKNYLDRTTDLNMPSTLMGMCDFSQALELLMDIDFDRIVEKSMTKESYSALLHNKSVVAMVQRCFNTVLSLAGTFSDIRTALFCLDARNDSRKSKGLGKWYAGKAELLFSFIALGVWDKLSERVPTHDLTKIFDFLLDIPIPQGRGHDLQKLNKTFILNNLLKNMNETTAIQEWHKMGKLRDTYTLMAVISKCPDFSQAYGFVEAFINDVGKENVRLGRLFANKLLYTAACPAELEECVKLYKTLGLLKEQDIEKAAQAGVPPLCAINDEVVQIAVVGKSFISMDQCYDILRFLKDNNYTRPDNLFSKVVYRAPDFLSAYGILYGECDFITPEEQAILRTMPVAISHLIRKARTDEEVRIANSIVDSLIEEAAKNPEERSGILDGDHNIVAEYLRNTRLTAYYSAAIAFLARIESRTGVALSSAFINNPVLYLLWNDKYETTSFKTDETNRLILSHTKSPRRDLKTYTFIRFCKGKNFTKLKYNPPALDKAEPYPFINNDGTWEIKTVTALEFIKNMMKHRFAHPASLQLVLLSLVSDAKKNPGNRLRAKASCYELLNLAVEYGMFVNFDSYVSTRTSLRIFDDKKLEEKLSRIVTGYSLTKDICVNMHSANITVDEALEKLKDFEKTNHIRLYRTTALYDALIHRLTLDPMQDVDSILNFRHTFFPEDIPWTDEQKFFILNKIRSFEDFKSLKAEFGCMPAEWPRAIISAVKEMNSTPEAFAKKDEFIRTLLRIEERDGKVYITPVLFDSGTPASVYVGLYSYLDNMNFDKLYALIIDNNLRPDALVFPYLARKAKSVAHLKTMESLEGFTWTEEIADCLLYNLKDNKFFKGNDAMVMLGYIRTDLMERFRQLYRQSRSKKGTSNLSSDCLKIYNDTKFVMPTDKHKKNLSVLASVCWEIING